MNGFALRRLEPTDGPALDRLLRSEAQTTSMRLTTRYLHDVCQALLAQHPSLFGVVAEAPGVDGLVGMATAFLAEVTALGAAFPAAYLENLKVRHDVRRQGLGGRLAAWRIEEAHRRFGREGLIVTGVEASNTASLATAGRWATQVLGPLRVVISGTTSRRPAAGRIEVRPLTTDDIEAVVRGVNGFHAQHNLFPLQTPELLADAHATTSLGEPIRQYRVAATSTGDIVAGASVTERFKLMVDHIEAVPLPIAVVGRLAGLLPPDRVIRSVEVTLVWHAPGHLDAVRLLWDAIRWEWHGRCTNVATTVDPRGTLVSAFGGGSRFAPRVQLMVPVQSATTLDEARPLYLWR